MSIFDSLKRTAESTLKKEAAKAVNNAVQSGWKRLPSARTHGTDTPAPVSEQNKLSYQGTFICIKKYYTRRNYYGKA